MGTSVFLAATGTELCPVSAVLCYLAERPRAGGPMFLLGSGEPLMRVQYGKTGICSSNLSVWIDKASCPCLHVH